MILALTADAGRLSILVATFFKSMGRPVYLADARMARMPLLTGLPKPSVAIPKTAKPLETESKASPVRKCLPVIAS